MLQVARLAPNLLQEASDKVADYFLDQFNDDGGAADRAGQSDLYYTVFALEGLIALQRELPPDAKGFLEQFGGGQDLDFVHLCCLARCWAAFGEPAPLSSQSILKQWDRDSIYHSFLAWGALQDLGEVPTPFEVEDGSGPMTTPTTAAMITLRRQMQLPVSVEAVRWLQARVHPDGGFIATEAAPIPDLLSTAIALHALAGQHVSFVALREPTLDFLDTLWTGKAFCGTWADDEPDCEYTYYGLLALGHLSLA